MLKKIVLVIISLCMISCTNIINSSQKDNSEYEDFPTYSGTFEGYMYFENHQNSMYLVREMYFDDLQPYILNESEFCNLLGKYNDNETEELSIPDIKLENYISDYDVIKEKNKYRIVYSIGVQSEDAFEEVKDLVIDFKFEIAFSDNAEGDEKNKYVEKLGDKVCFKLLNEGEEIIMQ